MINCISTSKAGMSFAESEGIHLENLIFDQCGALHDSISVNITSKHSTLLIYCTIYAFNSTDFSINNVTIRNSNGLGLTLFDVDGLVNTSNCAFENNIVAAQDADHIPGGGGVYVEFTYCPPGRYDDNCTTWFSDSSKTKHSTYTTYLTQTLQTTMPHKSSIRKLTSTSMNTPDFRDLEEEVECK